MPSTTSARSLVLMRTWSALVGSRISDSLTPNSVHSASSAIFIDENGARPPAAPPAAGLGVSALYVEI